MKVLVTGGAGFIGSTVGLACVEAGHDVVVLDDLSTGRREFVGNLPLYVGKISDHAVLDQMLADHPDISVVVHCAAKTIVPESITHPLEYYRTNVAATVEMLTHLTAAGLRRVVFSSSASVYGSGGGVAVTEASPVMPLSPYARTKLVVEKLLSDLAAAGRLQALALRYFNPIGADPGMRSGYQRTAPSHLLGRLLAADATDRPFQIFGGDWPTRDGTPIRDFIHVWDLARAHVAAVEHLNRNQTEFAIINVGTGRGTTVREMVDRFTTVSGRDIKIDIMPRRPGDTVGSYSVTERAETMLGWRSELSIDDAIEDSLRWSRRRLAWLAY